MTRVPVKVLVSSFGRYAPRNDERARCWGFGGLERAAHDVNERHLERHLLHLDLADRRAYLQ